MISVITPSSRGIKSLSHLIRDFKNQTLKIFEHLIIHDGEPSQEVKNFMKSHEKDYDLKFSWIKKDRGNIMRAPGTVPRNYGISLAKYPYCCFCDDDDRYKDSFLESLMSNTRDNFITVVQMSCQESRMYKNGSPDRIVLIPEIGLHQFPLCCHVGTPCFVVKKEWALQEPWQDEPEHDYRFIKRICNRFKPNIIINGGMQVDVDGLVTKGMRDWVSVPPFYRD